jgi:hypothetical protein
MPQALAYSDEYVWCWDEFSNWYYTLPMGRLDPRVASSTNMTFNQGNERAPAVDFDFSTNPMLHSNGWYFDYNALDHDAHSPFAFADLPYNWSKDDKALLVSAHRQGRQRHRYVRPVEDQTQANDIRGVVDFQIDAESTDPNNVILMGLFNAADSDQFNSLTLQVWNRKTIRVRLAGKYASITLAPPVSQPLVPGRRYRFTLDYVAAQKTLQCGVVDAQDPSVSIFDASASAASLDRFSMDEFGVALWNVDHASTPRSTAWQFRVHSVSLNGPPSLEQSERPQ